MCPRYLPGLVIIDLVYHHDITTTTKLGLYLASSIIEKLFLSRRESQILSAIRLLHLSRFPALSPGPECGFYCICLSH